MFLLLSFAVIVKSLTCASRYMPAVCLALFSSKFATLVWTIAGLVGTLTGAVTSSSLMESFPSHWGMANVGTSRTSVSPWVLETWEFSLSLVEKVSAHSLQLKLIVVSW